MEKANTKKEEAVVDMEEGVDNEKEAKKGKEDKECQEEGTNDFRNRKIEAEGRELKGLALKAMTDGKKSETYEPIGEGPEHNSVVHALRKKPCLLSTRCLDE